MTQQPLPSPAESPQCHRAFDDMPWLLNGSLPAQEARALEAHVAQCARCSDRLVIERELLAALRRRAGNVQQAPLAAWNRFEATVAATAPPPEAPAPAVPAAPGVTATRRRFPLRLALTLQAAAIVALSVAVLWMLVARAPVAPPSDYRTVASPDATLGAGEAAWRVVFGPDTAPPDRAALLAAQGLAVIAGPTADGVYTVTAAPDAAPRIAALRADPRVRLVEAVGAPTPADRGRSAP